MSRLLTQRTWAARNTTDRPCEAIHEPESSGPVAFFGAGPAIPFSEVTTTTPFWWFLPLNPAL